MNVTDLITSKNLIECTEKSWYDYKGRFTILSIIGKAGLITTLYEVPKFEKGQNVNIYCIKNDDDSICRMPRKLKKRLLTTEYRTPLKRYLLSCCNYK